MGLCPGCRKKIESRASVRGLERIYRVVGECETGCIRRSAGSNYSGITVSDKVPDTTVELDDETVLNNLRRAASRQR